MARIVPVHKVDIKDPQGKHLSRYREPIRIVASASQVGQGVRLHVPNDNIVIGSRADWERIKEVVEQAWEDNDQIQCKDPIW